MLRRDGSISDSRRASAIPLVAFALAALLPSAGCAVDAEDAPFELHGGEASVRVSLEPFQLTILGEGCVVANEEGGVSRLRLTTPLATTSDVAHEDVELSAKGPVARRIRWDVLRTR